MGTLKNIIRESGMSTRPEYYSGRGATTSDLRSDILEKIWKGINKELGKDPAEAFVQMVKDLPKASATSFLVSLYNLERNGWKHTPAAIEKTGIHVPKNEAGEYDTNAGMMGVMSAFFGGNDRDDTFAIKEQFLRSHGVKVEYPMEEEFGYYRGNGYYRGKR